MTREKALSLILVLSLQSCATQRFDPARLYEAARTGDVAAVRTLVERRVEREGGVASFFSTGQPCAAYYNGLDGQLETTPLHAAAGAGATEIVQILLDHGFKADLRDQSGTTPLAQAVLKNRLETAKALLDRKANPNATGPDGPILTSAVANGNYALATMLLNCGANPNAGHSEDGLTTAPLCEAVDRDRPDIVALLLSKNANVDQPCAMNSPALFLTNDPKIAKTLVSAGANIHDGARIFVCNKPQIMNIIRASMNSIEREWDKKLCAAFTGRGDRDHD